MSDVDLLFRLKADASGVTAGSAEARAAVTQLKTTFTSEMGQIDAVSKGALQGLSNQIAQIVRQVPVVGPTLAGITTQVKNIGSAAPQVDVLSTAFKKFSTTLAEVVTGKSGAAAAAPAN
jgi:uncharacterized linocin/CFP29 family protein